MKRDDNYFMQLALAEAKKSLRRGGIPVGAVLVSRSRVLAKGMRSKHNKAFLDHAEMAALRNLYINFKKPVRGLTIYTNLEPCVMCFGALLHAKIKRLVYALEDTFGGATSIKANNLPLRNRKIYPLISRGVLRRQSKELFRDYLKITKSKFWRNRRNPFVQLILS